MSDQSPLTNKFRVRNQRGQPLELHLLDRVVVVAPYAECELTSQEMALPQVAHLLQRRVIRAREVQFGPTPQAVVTSSAQETTQTTEAKVDKPKRTGRKSRSSKKASSGQTSTDAPTDA